MGLFLFYRLALILVKERALGSAIPGLGDLAQERRESTHTKDKLDTVSAVESTLRDEPYNFHDRGRHGGCRPCRAGTGSDCRARVLPSLVYSSYTPLSLQQCVLELAASPSTLFFGSAPPGLR